MGNEIKTVPFRGGVNTVLNRALLTDGKFSVLQNFRQRHPGLEQRLGQIYHHTTEDAGLTTLTLFSFSAAEVNDKRLFRQLSDGSVQEATDLPPTVTTGAFGSTTIPAVTGALPASWSVIGDKVLFSDGVRQHELLIAHDSRIKGFVVYKSMAIIPRIPINGEEYINEVTDNSATTAAKIGGIDSNYDAIFVLSYIPINKINWTIATANTGPASILIDYWNGTAFVNVAGLVDGTALAGAAFAQSGVMTWTLPTDELPNYQFGKSGFWYRVRLSTPSTTSGFETASAQVDAFQTGGAPSTIDAGTTATKVTCSAPWQEVRNVWDGVMSPAIEAQVYNTVQDRYYINSTSGINLGGLTAGDWCYFSANRPLFGMFIDTGATPNIINAKVSGTDISFAAGGSSDGYIKRASNDFLTQGFEPGMSITITGSASNNLTTEIMAVTSSTIYVATGVLTDEAAGANATITFGTNTTAMNTLQVWTGSAWNALTSLDDTTKGLTKSGYVTWDRNSVIPQKTQFNESSYYAYWYRFKFDKTLSKSVNIGIDTLPYYGMESFGNGVCNAAWKNRAVYSFDKFPQYIYITASDSPMVLNGTDYGLIEVGDGRSNRVRAMRKFYNELLVWQEEKGEDGGCTTLIEGYSPETYGKIVLSSRVGILNAKSAVVVDGVMTSTRTEETLKTLTYWLSRYGVAMTDGRLITIISDDIRNYFDPTKPECIRKGYEDQMWIGHDSADNVLRIGLVSGNTATAPNIFPVYDLTDKTWSFDVLGQPLSCMTEAEAGAGVVPALQMGGGAADGYVYQLNQTNDDVTTPIDAEVVQEIDGQGRILRLREEALQIETKATGNISMDIARNGGTTYGSAKNLSMTPINAGDIYRRHRFNNVVDGHHISLRHRHNTAGEGAYLLRVGLAIENIDNNA